MIVKRTFLPRFHVPSELVPDGNLDRPSKAFDRTGGRRTAVASSLRISVCQSPTPSDNFWTSRSLLIILAKTDRFDAVQSQNRAN